MLLSISGCKKFITKDIVGEYPESEFYKTQAQAILAINAAYQPLAFTTSNNNRLWVFGDVASDDAVKGGDPGDQADIDLIDQFNINSINGNLAVYGRFYMKELHAVILCLHKVPPIQMDKTYKQEFLAKQNFCAPSIISN